MITAKRLNLLIVACTVLWLIPTASLARRIYVKGDAATAGNGSSWMEACSDLHVALREATAGDTLWVSVGTYEGGFIMPEGVTVIGGFLGTEQHANQRLLPQDGGPQSILNGNRKYHVLVQQADYNLETTWDSFVITQGIGVKGAGVQLHRNGVLRNCIVQNNNAGVPAIGDYVGEQGGVVLQSNATTARGVVMSAHNYGGYYQHNRAGQVVALCTEGGHNDWRLPTTNEVNALVTAAGNGRHAFTPAYYVIDETIRNRGGESLADQAYWASNTATEQGAPVAYTISFQNAQVTRISTWYYHQIRPVRSATFTKDGGVGGGVYATDGSALYGCIVRDNTATTDAQLHLEGDVLIGDYDERATQHLMALYIIVTNEQYKE